jgi:hypothetical protein
MICWMNGLPSTWTTMPNVSFFACGCCFCALAVDASNDPTAASAASAAMPPSNRNFRISPSLLERTTILPDDRGFV